MTTTLIFLAAIRPPAAAPPSNITTSTSTHGHLRRCIDLCTASFAVAPYPDCVSGAPISVRSFVSVVVRRGASGGIGGAALAGPDMVGPWVVPGPAPGVAVPDVSGGAVAASVPDARS